MNSYPAGQIIRLQATFIASGGAYAAPASVYAQVRNPLGSVATYGLGGGGVVSVNTGAFYLDVVPTYQGRWDYRFQGLPSVGYAGDFSSFHIDAGGF